MRLMIGLFGAFLMATLVAACGGDATATPTTAPTAVPTSTPAPTPTPVVPQELVANIGADPGSLDPQTALVANEHSVVRQLLHGLFRFKADLSLEPLVAAEIPSVGNGGVSEDGLTYTIKLRDDVTWSDGLRVTAGDFVYSLKRLFDPQVGSPAVGPFMVISGAPQYFMSGEADAATQASLRDAIAIQGLDDFTLQITLAGPSPTFLQQLLATSKSGTHWEPRDQGLDGGLVSSLRALL